MSVVRQDAPLVESELAGIRALAVELTKVERGGSGLRAVRRSASAVVGLVGAPGVGKSSIISSLVAAARARGERVVVLAVDPSSPVTGGALLGDRIRMARHSTDPGTFVRSFASRGHPGGLAAAIPAAVETALALGWDRVFIEPVGGGQNDIDAAACADRLVLVVSPESGDDVQALKAGILEMADIIAVNKADRPGASALRVILRSQLGPRGRGNIILVSAAEDHGIDELDARIRSAATPDVVRRSAAELSAVLNDATVALRKAMDDPVLRGEVLVMVRAGERPAAVRHLLESAHYGRE
jgi:LAO/AO transport system kinase